MDKSRICVYLEFTKTGYLKSIYMNADNNSDQVSIERALSRLIKPNHFSWVRRLFNMRAKSE